MFIYLKLNYINYCKISVLETQLTYKKLYFLITYIIFQLSNNSSTCFALSRILKFYFLNCIVFVFIFVFEVY